MAPTPPPQPALAAPPAWGTLLDAASDLLALLDSQGRIVWANASFLRASGHALVDAVGQEAATLLGTPDEAWRALAHKLRLNTGFEPLDLPWRHRTGQARFGRVAARALSEGERLGAACVLLSVQDTTTAWNSYALNRDEQMEKLREASELAKRLAIAVNAAGVGIWSRHPNDERTTWNEQMFHITGRPMHLGGPTRDEWIYQIVHPDDRSAMLQARADISQETMAVEHECRIVRPDGEVRWIVNRARREPRDGILMVIGITLDVTERVLAEAALHRVNERAALAARAVGMGTWEWNVTTGEAVWDEAMFHLRGLAPQAHALNQQQRLATTHPDDIDLVNRELSDAAANAGPSAYEFRVIWPDGSVHWIASRSTPAPDAYGKNVRRIGVNWDITQAKNAETSRREREVALRESQSKSDFLSRMSHELRTPLNAVLGFAQLLQLDAATLQDQQLLRVAHIQSAGEHLLALIDDVLDLSSLDSEQFKLDLQAVPIAQVVSEAMPLVDSLAQTHSVSLRTGAVDGVWWGDRTRLRQVLINLLSNAIKYNQPQGVVVLTSEVSGDHAIVRIEDSGRGMSPEQLAHLFEPFNRLGIDREGIPGTGIGLAVVKALVERMGGSVQASSQPGIGSSFEVRLPSASAPAGHTPVTAPTSPPPAPVRAALVRSGTLLYIEDNPVNVLLVEELVRMRPGLRIESAPNGLEGVAHAAALRPDLILVDIQLPDIDGFEVLARLKAQPETAHTPCIALSANAMPEDISRASATGFIDYWTKPIDFGAFLAALDRLFPAA